jgi:hypothetical protein
MKNKTIYSTEKRINNILFGICIVITIIALGMKIVEFFSRGGFPRPRVSYFYIGILVIYSIHKEALRWIEHKEFGRAIERKGEYFVYIWIGVTTILYVINFFTKGYFCVSPQGQELSTLADITFTTLEVGGVFLLTRLLKIRTIYLFKKSKK